MTKILTVLCGGTIGSRAIDGEITTDRGGALCVAERYKREHGDAEFTVAEPFCIPSEEIGDSFYTELVNWFGGVDLSGFDGVIITHGTDTLSFTAPIFSFAFCGVSIPLLFVSADYVPDDPRSNAHRNFADAVAVIKSGARGVYSVSDGAVILASRLCEADWLHNRFTSFDGRPVMTVSRGKTDIVNGRLYKAVQEYSGTGVRVPPLQKSILMISPYPGIDYSAYNVREAAAVLHTLYHSATADSHRLADFIGRCRAEGKDFYISPVKRGDRYTSAVRLAECGAIPIYETSREAALAKLKIAYNGPAAERRRILASSIYFEQLNCV